MGARSGLELALLNRTLGLVGGLGRYEPRWRAQAQARMRVDIIVIPEPGWQLPEDRDGVWPWILACQVAFQGFNEGLVDAGALRAVDLSRFCAAPLITYCAAKEMSHEHRQDG
jgi:hypothetical protein